MKKFVCVLLSLLMVFSMSPLAFATDIAGESNSAISPVDYQYVAAEIAAAQDETVIQQMSEDIHYYWSTNSFVVQDGSGYYLVEFDKNNDLFYVNGKPFRITISTTSNAIPKSGNSSGFPTPWVTVIDSKSSFDVGGLPASVVGGIVGGALGGGSGAVAGAVICAVAGMLIDGVFPIDYNLTVTHLKSLMV